MLFQSLNESAGLAHNEDAGVSLGMSCDNRSSLGKAVGEVSRRNRSRELSATFGRVLVLLGGVA
jgi:hypothetical protein